MRKHLLILPAMLVPLEMPAQDDAAVLYGEMTSAYEEDIGQYRNGKVLDLLPDTMPIHAEFLNAAKEQAGTDAALPFLGWILRNAPRNDEVHAAAIAEIAKRAEARTSSTDKAAADAMLKTANTNVRELKYGSLTDEVFAKTLEDLKVVKAVDPATKSQVGPMIFQLERLQMGARVPDISAADRPEYLHIHTLPLDWAQIRNHMAIVHYIEALRPVRAGRGKQQAAPVVLELQSHLRIGQGVVGDKLVDLFEFAGNRTQGVEAYGGAGKEIVDPYPCPHRTANGPSRDALSRCASHLDPLKLIGLAGGQFDISHGSDAGQRFAAKAERGELSEVIKDANLAGGKSLKGQFSIFRTHPDAIVGDLNQPSTAIFEQNIDAGTTGVEGIVDQLLHHRCRALDHFPGGNTASRIGIEPLYA